MTLERAMLFRLIPDHRPDGYEYSVCKEEPEIFRGRPTGRTIQVRKEYIWCKECRLGISPGQWENHNARAHIKIEKKFR